MPRDADATRARILDAAVAEFSARGLAGARIDRIAEAAAANKRMIYVHFGSKDGLFDKARGRMVGSQDYLTKPFTKEQLLRAVQQFGAGGDTT